MMTSIRVSEHAVRRAQQHHRGIDVPGVLAAILAGQMLDPDLAHALMGRPVKKATTDHYIAAADHRGIYIIAADGVVVTYARLPEQARAILRGADPVGGMAVAS